MTESPGRTPIAGGHSGATVNPPLSGGTVPPPNAATLVNVCGRPPTFFTRKVVPSFTRVRRGVSPCLVANEPVSQRRGGRGEELRARHVALFCAYSRRPLTRWDRSDRSRRALRSAVRSSLAESLEAARITGQATQEADTLSTLAWLDAAQGRADDCNRHVKQGLEIEDKRGLRWRNGLLHALVVLELGLGVNGASSELVRFDVRSPSGRCATRRRTRPRQT